MTQLGRTFCTLATVLMVAALSTSGRLGHLKAAPTSSSTLEAAQRDEGRKPSLSLKATPPVGFSPLRVRVVVELKGGSDGYADYYCPTIEWDWADGTISESSEDCDPYEAGKSTIKRRYSAEHVFKSSGMYQVYFRLKQRDKTLASSSANVQVRAGVRDEFER
jgi:hypothetical protein